MSDDPRVRLDAIKQRVDRATPGPWFWRNIDRRVRLERRDQSLVMSFTRNGMRDAQPVLRGPSGFHERTARRNLYDFPDADLIAHAPTDLVKLVDALEAVLDLHVACDVTCDNNGVVLPIEEPWCDADGTPCPCPTIRAITDALDETGGEK